MLQKRPQNITQQEQTVNNFFNLSTIGFKEKNFFKINPQWPNKLLVLPIGGQVTDILNYEASSILFKNSPKERLYDLTVFLKPHWTRFMFRGKAFRLRYYKFLNRFIFNLGYSHISKLGLSSNFLGARKPRPRERTRQRYAIFTFNFKQLLLLKREAMQVKPYNFYTQRGLRLRSQGIGRRFGKISQHISSLH